MANTLAHDTSNIGQAYSAFLDEIRELGRTKGRGLNAQISAAVQCVERSSEQVINVKQTGEIYDAFLGGEVQAGSATGTAKDESKDYKVRISELRQFVKMGGLKIIDPVKLIHDAVSWVNKAKANGKLGAGTKTYSALVSIARAQNKIGEQHQLEEDEAIAAAQPKVGREKEGADYWGAVRDRIEKIRKEFGTSEDIDKVQSSVQLIIDDLGGTSADRKRSIKARAELAKLQGTQPQSQGQPPPVANKKTKKK